MTRRTVNVWAWIAVVWAAGCAGPAPLPPAPPIDVKAVNQVVGPGIDEPLARASQAEIPGDPLRLGDDVQRAATRLEWGVGGFSDTIPQPGTDPAAAVAPPAGAGAGVVRCRALLPDGRAATIVAWPVEPATYDEKGKKLLKPGRVGVALRVGYFGDAKKEARFIRTLAQYLAGDPKPKRGWGFTLPPLEGDDSGSRPRTASGDAGP